LWLICFWVQPLPFSTDLGTIDSMLLLAADTSGKHGSIALARCEPDGACEVLEVVPLAGGTFSAQLVPQIAALLAKQNINKQQIDAFAVASGPGSFTGLRVGLAAIKALAEVLAKPIAAVSLLEAVAMAGGGEGDVIASLDAGRNEVYAGEYEVGASAKKHSERLLTREEFLEAAIAKPVITPDKTVSEVARSVALKIVEIERPRSDAIARIGWRKILTGETVSPEALDANYIRRSDAEIFSKTSF
jgi:tRNA threonylcarbamoyladenosine biosynthesis protein TsaB